jgi:hypothetical protein
MGKDYAVRGCGSIIIGLGSLILGLLMFIRGVSWFNETVMPWLIGSIPILFLIEVLLLLLSIKASARELCGAYMFAVANVILLVAWAEGVVMSYSTGGIFWLIVGLLMGWLGVIPVAIVGCLTHGYWTELVILILALGLSIGSQVLALSILRRAETTLPNSS